MKVLERKTIGIRSIRICLKEWVSISVMGGYTTGGVRRGFHGPTRCGGKKRRWSWNEAETRETFVFLESGNVSWMRT